MIAGSKTHINNAYQARLPHADAVRAFAILFVVVLHVSAGPVVWLSASRSFPWWIANAFDSAARPGVPLFVMLTGMLLLDSTKDSSPGYFLKRRVFRVLIPFVSWAIIYFFWRSWYHGETVTVLSALRELLSGPVYTHLWYVYMLIGLYLAIPVLRIFIQFSSTQYIRYFLVLWLIAASLIPFTVQLTEITVGIDFVVAVRFVGYLILGWVLRDIRFLSMQSKLMSIIALVILIMITAIGSNVLTLRSGGVFDETFYGYLSPNVVAMSTLWFILIKSLNYESLFQRYRLLGQGITFIAGSSYSIYLIHPIFQELLQGGMIGVSLSANTFSPLLAIPLTTTVTILLCVTIVSLFRFLRLRPVLAP